MYSGNGHFQYSRAITLKVGELRFMCSAHRLMVLNICIKFHENMSGSFKVMEQTGKLLTDTHTQKKQKLYTPLHTSYAGGITRDMVHVFCMSSHGLLFKWSFMKICQAVLNLWSRHENC